MVYRCVATTVAGFVQQLAVAYVAHGYWFYVVGRIPDAKDPVATDRKLMARYGIDVSKFTRARQKRAGQARMQYLRFERFFVLLATHGQHPFFAAEGEQIHDIRRQPLHFMGYAIGCRRGREGKWHASVRIERGVYAKLKAHFVDIAVKQTVEALCRELWATPFEPYAPVRDQLRGLLRAITRQRKIAGLELVPQEALRRRRAPVKPFG